MASSKLQEDPRLPVAVKYFTLLMTGFLTIVIILNSECNEE